MTDFFREVDEDVRRDRIIRVWKEHQTLLIALAVLLIAGTAAWQAYQRYRAEAGEQANAKLTSALQLARDGKPAEAAAVLDTLGKSGPQGYSTLARLRAAGDLSANDPQAAIKAYETLANDHGVPAAFRNFSQLRAALLRVDGDDPADFEKRYAPYAAAGFPYHPEMRELLGLAAIKRQAYEAAGRWLDGIMTDPQAPAGVRTRAGALLGLVQSSAAPNGTAAASPSSDKPAPPNSQEGTPPAK